MEYDRGYSFPFDFEPNGIPFGLLSNLIEYDRGYSFPFDFKPCLSYGIHQFYGDVLATLVVEIFTLLINWISSITGFCLLIK